MAAKNFKFVGKSGHKKTKRWEPEKKSSEFSFKKSHHSIHGSCFKNPESCYTIATLHYDKSEGCCDMKPVGPRLLELKKQDRKDFFKVYKIAEKNIRKESKD